jgi:hypothetical protein
MGQLKTFVNLQDSYIEIENWVIIDINLETGSITEYEDYELSAESFLVELKSLYILPSLKMPAPNTCYDAENNNEKNIADKGNEAEKVCGKDSEVDDNSGDENTVSYVDHTAARVRGKMVWAEIMKSLTSSLEAEDESTTQTKVENQVTTPEIEESDPSDSPNTGSESPHTDPDFMASSSDCTDVEWILSSGMVGLKVSDSLLLVESRMGEGVTGNISGSYGEEMEKEDKICDGSEEENENNTEEKDMSFTPEEVADMNDKHGSWDIERPGENSEDGTERDNRRRDLRNVSLAASATGVLLAALWMIERGSS